jgi:hypothetical protein
MAHTTKKKERGRFDFKGGKRGPLPGENPMAGLSRRSERLGAPKRSWPLRRLRRRILRRRIL